MLCIQTQEAIPKHKSTQKVNLCLIESDTEAGNYIYRGLYQFQVIMITNKNRSSHLYTANIANCGYIQVIIQS